VAPNQITKKNSVGPPAQLVKILLIPETPASRDASPLAALGVVVKEKLKALEGFDDDQDFDGDAEADQGARGRGEL